MTPAEIALLQSAGQTLGSNGSVLLIIGILYGIYVVTAYLALKSLLRRGFTRNISIWALFLGVVVTFMMTTAYSALYFQIYYEFIRVALEENTSQPLEIRFEIAGESIANASSAFQWLGGAGGGFIYLIGDAVSVWRVWAICSHSYRKLVFLPVILFLGGIGCSIGFNALNTPPVPFLFTGSAIWDFEVLGLILPLTTNVVATALIAHQTYSYKGFMTANFKLGPSKAESIMNLLTESGLVYCVVQAIDVTLILLDDAPLASPQDQATRLFNEITLFLSAMLPLFVILIVYNQHSITDTLHNGEHSGEIHSSILEAGTHISFANRDTLGGSNVFRSNTVGNSTDTQSNTTNQGADPSVEKLC